MLRDALLSEVIARDVSLSFWERVKSYARKTRGDWGESERTLFPSLDSPLLFSFFFVHTLLSERLEQALGGGREDSL